MSRARMQAEASWNSFVSPSGGYVVPGSRKKSMKGFNVTANSPDADITPKLNGMRAASRDVLMNSPLPKAILDRLDVDVVNSGFQLQSTIDRDTLGLTEEEAYAKQAQFEQEFTLWSSSIFSDFERDLFFAEAQSSVYTNMCHSGDVFFMLPWDAKKHFPYATTFKLIPADLVRDPRDKGNRDIQGGIERDSRGRKVAAHVYTSYENDGMLVESSVRVPFFDDDGRQLLFHVYEPGRLQGRRGVGIFNTGMENLKQLTRLTDAEVMSALLASYFTVFVKDNSGMGSVMGQAFTPEETLTGGGRYGPENPEVEEKNLEDANDLEMGHGNITYLGNDEDITLADPKKADEAFEKFWEVIARLISASAGVPIESALMNYQTSYTAARAAALDFWRKVRKDRALLVRRFVTPVYEAVISEAVIKGRLEAEGFFDEPEIKQAWLGARWIGVGQGSLNPLDEAKADIILKNNKMKTHEEAYVARTGLPYRPMVGRLASEYKLFDQEGLEDSSDAKDLVGSDGQRDPGER